jgi:hypothetical protein
MLDRGGSGVNKNLTNLYHTLLRLHDTSQAQRLLGKDQDST